MSNRESVAAPIIRDSVVIAIVIGIAASVFANSIYDALTADRPNWTFVVMAVFITISLCLARALWIVARAQPSPDEGVSVVPPPQDPVSLGRAAKDAKKSVEFLGILAKRSILDDSFKTALQSHASSGFTVRLLLANPESDAFRERAQDERESADAWRSDFEGTVNRLRHYKARYSIDIELRLLDHYPVWRLIVTDSQVAYVNVFLPDRRGTESEQRLFDSSDAELAYGFCRMFRSLWDSAQLEVPL